jgi:hypothetical protein
MKKLFIGLFLILCLCGFASAQSTTTIDLKFVWNSNTEEDLAGYGFYSNLTPGPSYYIVEDGIPPSETEIVDFTLIGAVVNINAPTYFAADAFDESGNRSGFSNPVEYIHCVPLANETQVLSCPVGQTGSIIQTRTSSCTSNSLPVWSDWVQTSNTCKAVSTCVSKTETRTVKCPIFYKGNTIQTRTLICNVDGTSTWSGWTTVSSTCRPWWKR